MRTNPQKPYTNTYSFLMCAILLWIFFFFWFWFRLLKSHLTPSENEWQCVVGLFYIRNAGNRRRSVSTIPCDKSGQMSRRCVLANEKRVIKYNITVTKIVHSHSREWGRRWKVGGWGGGAQEIGWASCDTIFFSSSTSSTTANTQWNMETQSGRKIVVAREGW